MKKIRKSVYETNSSSTHSICVTKNTILDQKNDSIHFKIGEFGWEQDSLYAPSEKASYLYTAILGNERVLLLEHIKKVLNAHNVAYTFEEPKCDENKWLNWGYIDHAGDLHDFLDALEQNEDGEKLMKFLFHSESFILTGNDNCCSDVDIEVDYEHEEFYKGN